MSDRAAYFKGVRLWETLDEWDAPAERGELGQNVGLHQAYAVQFGDSPNFSRPQLRVQCTVGRVTAYADLDERATLDLVMAQVEAALLAAGTASGDLAIVYDTTKRAQVDNAGPYSAGTAVVVGHGALGGSWVPTTGRYVLVRSPSTGVGWVSQITATGAGTVTINLDAQIDVNWELVYVQVWFADVWYVRTGHGERDAEQDVFRKGVEYVFSGVGNPITATAHAVPRGNA